MRTQKLKRPASLQTIQSPLNHTPQTSSSISTYSQSTNNTVKNQRRRAAAAPPYRLNASSSKSHPTAKKNQNETANEQIARSQHVCTPNESIPPTSNNPRQLPKKPNLNISVHLPPPIKPLLFYSTSTIISPGRQAAANNPPPHINLFPSKVRLTPTPSPLITPIVKDSSRRNPERLKIKTKKMCCYCIFLL